MMTQRLGILLVLAATVVGAGCSTSSVEYVGEIYYAYGPEAALEAADVFTGGPGDRALADLGRAMAQFELGAYEESIAWLDRAIDTLDAEASIGWTGDPKASPWRPEIHERVLASTLLMANALALQDPTAAAWPADEALAAVERADCEACGFGFTRVLAAITLGDADRFEDGLAALDGLDTIGRGADLVEAVRDRLGRGVPGIQSEGLAPPPVDLTRTVVVILLIGRGPYKAPDELAVTAAETVPWLRFLPHDPQTVSWAALEIEEPAVSVELTDVDELATVALRLRAERVVAAGGAGVDPKKRDLRHWASLPASMQIIATEIDSEIASVDLVTYSPAGDEVTRETIELPPSWPGGPIYIARRVP